MPHESVPIFSKYANYFWKILSLGLIPINIVIMLYMFRLVDVPGIDPVEHWQRGLWLSQYIGLFCCYLVLTNFQNPDLNGAYAFTFLFPHIAFFQSFGNVFTILNHFPHFLGWFVLFNPKIKMSRRGIYWGFGFVMVWLMLCFVLQYPAGMGANANNISDEYFPAILLGGLIWVGIVDRLWMRKAQNQANCNGIQLEQQEQTIRIWIPRIQSSKLMIGNSQQKMQIRLLGGIGLLGSIGIIMFNVMSRNPISMIWASTIFLLLTSIGFVSYPKFVTLRLLYPGVILSLLIETLIRISTRDFVAFIFLAIVCIFTMGTIYIKKKNPDLKLNIIDPVGLGAGFYLQGILYLLTASLSYHLGWMEFNINFVKTQIPMILLLISLISLGVCKYISKKHS